MRGCVALACLALGLAVVFPQTANALSSALGRWAGGGPGGRIQFVVSRVRGTLVLSDLVVSCGTAEGEDPDVGPMGDGGRIASGEAAIERNGRIHDDIRLFYRQFLYPISGHLGRRSGTVTADATMADESESGSRCPRTAFRDVRVAPSGAREVRDGIYSLSGPIPGTGGIFYVYGEGALIQNGGAFGTPVGGLEDDPEACAESVAAAVFPDYPFPGPPELPSAILPASNDSFSLHTVEGNDPAFLDEVTLSGRFTTTSTGVGVYSGTSVYEALTCVGAGAFALTLSRPAPPLVPVGVPGHRKRRIPTVVFSMRIGPAICANFDAAVRAGAPTVLNRITSKDRRRRNRREALRGRPPAGAGFQWDEYPFASTRQGGAGARVMKVPAGENSYQGRTLSSFYRRRHIGNGTAFRVKCVRYTPRSHTQHGSAAQSRERRPGNHRPLARSRRRSHRRDL
jgi:hypothetical protein